MWHGYARTVNEAWSGGGYYPQNIFRLLTRTKWQNIEQEVYFKILKVNTSQNSNRNESNGVLLFSHYQDADNLYYGGIRVDGYAVIKKKVEGDYHTLAYEPVYTADAAYHRDTNSNLIPEVDRFANTCNQ